MWNRSFPSASLQISVLVLSRAPMSVDLSKQGRWLPVISMSRFECRKLAYSSSCGMIPANRPETRSHVRYEPTSIVVEVSPFMAVVPVES